MLTCWDWEFFGTWIFPCVNHFPFSPLLDLIDAALFQANNDIKVVLNISPPLPFLPQTKDRSPLMGLKKIVLTFLFKNLFVGAQQYNFFGPIVE